MASPKLLAPVVSSVVTATVILSTVAYISLTSGKDNKDTANGKAPTPISTNHGGPPIVGVPEANAGLVMIPFFGAVLAFSSFNLLRPKTAKNRI